MPETESLFFRKDPPPHLIGLVSRIAGYEERGTGLKASREVASLVVPLVISFAEPFSIAFDSAPKSGDAQPSFAAGLHPGYVQMDSPGAAACVQVNFTPLGARLFFGMPMSELASRMVAIDALDDRGVSQLRERLGEIRSWHGRLDATVDFLHARLSPRSVHPDSASIYGAILRSGGSLRMEQLTDELGWSRKRLSAHCRDAFGITPKALSRIVRFNRAVEIASSSAQPDWSGLAADCGYADQAHMVREFVQFAGGSPERWRETLAR